MRKERIDDLVDILSEEYATLENTFVIRNNEQLARYLDNPTEWVEKQRANRNAYKNKLVRYAHKDLKHLNAMTERVFLVAYKEVSKDQIEITGKEIIAKDLPKNVIEQIKSLKQENLNKLTELVNATLETYTRQVQIIATTSNAENLYNVVKEQMIKGVDKGVKIVYKDGKKFSWKAYMEMNIRTTIHQEIANDQVKRGATIGQIFYMCDSYSDCAKDHADWQGKLYYNADVPNIPVEVQTFIQRKNILSMQQVMQNEPYLTTRPNCRHNFHAIPLDEAMGLDAKAILSKYGFSNGKYKDSNYEKRMQQRYNERMIRKYKLRKLSREELAKATGDETLRYRTRDDILIAKWQQRNRKLISSNKKLLQRDYDRENPRVITQDLGVRYDYSFKDGVIQEK